ncbi:LuxR C-terminal-related transcriptional regulator [Paenibacillus eucommiae]|uniref:DNA-binding CsgD family transcriptional regulator n=1 Tax=Paenibacillus eucommiae TaxID=1355755 RepID=A0ABS4IVN4_9BACL|nr:LuxR C-terminal-related transcriptional regulator [Paenibacillus eucommiae]MBP1991644.1 DNA-binding CsgD family transcriptional regulator [Paenibacillus eucommiae]
MHDDKVKAGGSEERIAARIDQLERHYLVGRDIEIQYFIQQLTVGGQQGRILNLYGTGGVGKSYLIDEFRRLAVNVNAAFLLMDSRGFSHTPQDFCTQLLRMLGYPMEKLQQITDPQALLELCLDILREKAVNQKHVLALDTFEDMGDMELWLREAFLPQLYPEILILIAGRFPLQGIWLSSPAWRYWIHRMPVGDLDYFSVKEYLERSGISQEPMIKQIWMKTRGHPLTLSLIVSTTMVQNIQGLELVDGTEVFEHIVSIWLKEVPDDNLRELVETVAVLRHFNQELLSYVLDQEVKTDLFQWLIGLSFIRRVDRGWILHDLMRDAIGYELRLRQPEHYDWLWKRCIMYYYSRMTNQSKRKTIAWEGVEWYYYIGDHVVRNFCYQKLTPYLMEPLSPSNWAEAEQYLDNRRSNPKEICLPLQNPETGEMFEYMISKEESLYSVKHIHLQELYELDPGIVKLMRDQQGTICGLTAIIPIHTGTLDYLLTHPLSSTYFQSLPDHRLKELRVPIEHIAGYFVKTIDVSDFEDVAMRTTAGLTFISLLISSDYVVAAPPDLSFLKDFHLSLGCEQAKNVAHYDYDSNAPAPYYVLDTRGGKLQGYLNKMIASFGLVDHSKQQNNDMPMLSEREKEVVVLLVKGYTNQEIAADLYITEVTVKKHLTAVFRKLNVRNRTQLVNSYLKKTE